MAKLHAKGFHRVILPTGEVLQQAIVYFDEEEKPVSWHTFRQEEPFVEWVGGEMNLMRN